MKLEFDGACAEAFDIVKEITAWRLDKDGLRAEALAVLGRVLFRVRLQVV